MAKLGSKIRKSLIRRMRNGLQSRLRRFDSDPSLQFTVSGCPPGELLRGALWLLWHALRLPVLVFLVILEPVVRFILGALALPGILAASFFKAYGVPHFPFVLMLGISVGARIDAGRLPGAAAFIGQLTSGNGAFRRPLRAFALCVCRESQPRVERK